MPPDLPIIDAQLDRKMKLIGRKLKAGQQELMDNPRCRSAVLRVAQKL